MLASGCLGGSKRSLLFGHFLSSELFNGGLDLFLKAGIVTVEGTAEARLFIEDNEHGAVDEQIFGSSLFCGGLFLGDEFQAFDNEFGDVVLWAGKKPPATIVSFETGGILLEDRRGFVGGSVVRVKKRTGASAGKRRWRSLIWPVMTGQGPPQR